jgi:hypothetical protein
MQIRLVVEGVCKQIQCRLLTSKLERLAGDRGPGSFRSPEFVAAELDLGVVLADLAKIEYAVGREECAEQSQARAEQIYNALLRFLPRSELGDPERTAMQVRLARLERALAKLQDRQAAA